MRLRGQRPRQPLPTGAFYHRIEGDEAVNRRVRRVRRPELFNLSRYRGIIPQGSH